MLNRTHSYMLQLFRKYKLQNWFNRQRLGRSAKISVLQFQVQNLTSKVLTTKKKVTLSSSFSTSEILEMVGEGADYVSSFTAGQDRERTQLGRKQWVKEQKNTYQCKQDCGISHFWKIMKHTISMFPGIKQLHLFDYNSHTSLQISIIFYSYPSSFFISKFVFMNEKGRHIQYTLKGRKKSLPWELISNKYKICLYYLNS